MTIHSNPSAEQAYFHPKPDGRTDPAGEAGWYLQRERENRGIPLDKAGQDTGIHPYHLQALERGDLSALPERAEALRMVGVYARYLGFDPQPLVAHYGKLMTSEKPQEKAFSSAKVVAFPLIERLKSATSGAGGVAASILAVVLLFGGGLWLFMPGAAQKEEGAVVVTAENAAKQGAAPAAPESGGKGVRTVASISQLSEEALKDDEAQGGPGSMAELIARTVPGIAAPQEQQKIAEASQGDETAAPAPAKAEKALAPPSGAAAKGFVLRATGDIWVRIEDASGNTLFSGLMKKGDTYTVPKKKGLTIIARDGSLLEWLMDGKVMGRLTAPGEVLVGAPLTPEALSRGKG